MKQFIITEEERKRILGIHEQRTSRHYLMEEPMEPEMDEEIIEQYDNSLYSDIMELIHDSNSSHEETIDVLNSIVDEMSSSKRMRRNVEKRFRDEMNEQSPYAPGMAPKTTTPAGVNPTNKSSIKYTGEFKNDPIDELNKKEFERFIKSQSGGMQGNLLDFVPISNKIARVNGKRRLGYSSLYIQKENLPKDINTNPCYSNLKFNEYGDLDQVDVKISCKKEYQKLVYLDKGY